MSVNSKDIRMNEQGEIVTKDGDFDIWVSNQEHAVAITVTNLNDWKENPQTGFGVEKYQNAPLTNNLFLKQELKQMLKDDGFNVQDLELEYDISNDKLKIKTNARRNR